MIRGGFVSFFLPIRTKVLESEEINKFLELLIWNHYLKLNFSTSLPELICYTLKTDFPKISCYFFSLLKRGCSKFSKAVSWAPNRCESAIFSLINQNHEKHFWRKKLFFINWLIFEWKKWLIKIGMGSIRTNFDPCSGLRVEEVFNFPFAKNRFRIGFLGKISSERKWKNKTLDLWVIILFGTLLEDASVYWDRWDETRSTCILTWSEIFQKSKTQTI